MWTAYRLTHQMENPDRPDDGLSQSPPGQPREWLNFETSPSQQNADDEVASFDALHHANIAAESSDEILKSQGRVAPGATANCTSLKRRRSDEDIFSMTPRGATGSFGGSLTLNLNLNCVDKATSVPTMDLRSEKRRRLQSPFDAPGPSQPRIPKQFGNNAEEVFKELNQTLREQAKVLAEILEVLRKKHANSQ